MRYLSLLLPSLVFLSCEKEITIDYRQASPRYVVEASVSDSGMAARISRTQGMNDNTTDSDVSHATVTIAGNDGSRATLGYTGNGYYKATATGVPGVEYTIDVNVDGHRFSSASTMQKQPRMNKFGFVWKKIMNDRFLMGKLLIQDIPNESNWYFMHIYRNGLGYRWAVKRDDTDPNKELQQLFTFDREGSHEDDMLLEGDRLHIEIRAIDQRTYDYLYSMQLMNNTNTNPIANFSGGCLGYFSAYSQISYDCVYHERDVTDEE